MKKLFILLSILAITTPSYACGCEGPSKMGLLIAITIFCFLFIILPSLIVSWISSKGKSRTAFSHCCASLVLTVLFAMGVGTFISSNILSSSKIVMSTLICMLVIILHFFMKALDKETTAVKESTQ